MEYNYLTEALANYDIDKSDVEFIRHNENMTYRVGKQYLLQIHEPLEGFSTGYLYEKYDRTEIRKSEIVFQQHLKKQGMQIREVIENRSGQPMTRLKCGTCVTVSKWIPGESLDNFKLDDTLCIQIGQLIGRLHRYAAGFSVSPSIVYDQQHCHAAKTRIQCLQSIGLDPAYSEIMQMACDIVGARLHKVRNEYVMLHGDLSPSNILKTDEGLVAIDFSFLGMGHPMYDLAVMFGNVGGVRRRQKIAEGYRAAGGTIRYEILDACYVLANLDFIGIHYDQCRKQDWYETRMKQWYQEIYTPFVNGHRLFANDFVLIHSI